MTAFGSPSSILQMICASIGITSSLFSFAYIQYKLKLNNYLKWILRSLAILICTCNSFILLGFGLMSQETFHSILTCSLTIHPTFVASTSSINASFVISCVRYFMYQRSIRTRIAKPWELLGIILTGVLGHQIIVQGTFLVLVQFKVPSAILTCGNVEAETNVPLMNMVSALAVAVQACLGLYFDLRLRSRMIKKNQVGAVQDQLVPWNKTDQEEDLKIPTKATIVSFFMFFCWIFFALFLNIAFFLKNDLMLWVLLIFASLYPSFHLPIILLFTVKHHKTLIEKQPPKSLQFHDNKVPAAMNVLHFHEEFDDDLDENESKQSDVPPVNVLTTHVQCVDEGKID